MLDWSEVWALLIPLTFFLLMHKPIEPYLKPVIIYLWIALLLNGYCDITWKFYKNFGFHEPMNNNYVYNTHSIIRFLLFSRFFVLLNQPFLKTIKKWIPVVFIFFLIINFSFFDKFYAERLSSTLLSIEAGLLLFYCLQYYLYLLQEELISPFHKQPGFWFVTGLTLYVAINFFIFLLYSSMPEYDAADLWNVHNISYIVLCCFITKALNDQ